MAQRSSSVTIRDVARKAGVSPATVSRYLTSTVPVSEETAQRIQAVMDELRYTPNTVARQLATQRSHAIGLLLPDFSHTFFTPLIGGIEAVVSDERYSLLLATRVSTEQSSTPSPIGPHNAEGLIIFPGTLNDQEIIRLNKAGYPLVVIYRSAPLGSTVPSITAENVKATAAIIDHLIEEHGRSRIVFVRGPDEQEDSHRREQGYRASLQAHGIEYDEQLTITGMFDRTLAYRAMSAFLNSEPPHFDAVFTGNDDSAIGIMDALREEGIQIPDDVSVVGFDDMELSSFLSPPLTTVHAPTEQVGTSAARCLFDLLAGKEVDLTTFLPTEIVIRRSCGCPHERSLPPKQLP
jgi:LacI family transcriptional regulator